MGVGRMISRQYDLREGGWWRRIHKTMTCQMKVLKYHIIPHVRDEQRVHINTYSVNMLLNVYCVCNSMPNVGIIHETPRQTKC